MYRFFSTITFFFLAVALLGSCQQKEPYSPESWLTGTEQVAFKNRIIRYVAELPKHATYANRFESRFDAPYRELAEKTFLDKYYLADDGYIYFEVRKRAPSLKIKYNATGGRLKLDSLDNIIDYEEIYRTWKMEDELLSQKTRILFPKMIAGADLSLYYTENSKQELIIEFPDKNVVYSTAERRWVTKSQVNQLLD